MPRNTLFVEGKDDAHVLWHLLEYYKVPETFKVIAQEGKDNLTRTLKDELLDGAELEAKDGKTERLGIIIDADLDVASRWQAIRDRLITVGYQNVPDRPEPRGTIIPAIIEQPRRPKFGVWIMPDNTLPGMLEDFVSYLIPSKDLLWTKATRAVNQIPPKQQRFIEEHRTKAHIHTWLAWQEKPGLPMGTAINSRYLDPTMPQAQLLVSWIRQLFERE